MWQRACNLCRRGHRRRYASVKPLPLPPFLRKFARHRGGWATRLHPSSRMRRHPLLSGCPDKRLQAFEGGPPHRRLAATSPTLHACLPRATARRAPAILSSASVSKLRDWGDFCLALVAPPNFLKREACERGLAPISAGDVHSHRPVFLRVVPSWRRYRATVTAAARRVPFAV